MKSNAALMGQQSSYSYMLIKAQEQKNLASRLINLKPTVDNKEPRRYNHLNKQKGIN